MQAESRHAELWNSTDLAVQFALSRLEERHDSRGSSRCRSAAGARRYVGKVRDGEALLALLESQLEELRSAFGRFPKARGTYRYAPGKWSVKERLVCHLSDTERIF